MKLTMWRVVVVLNPGGGGHQGIFWVGICAARDSKLPPRSKTNSPKIDTPFQKWANFLYPVLEFALKLIPRSRNGPIFYTPFQKVYKLKWPCFFKRYFFICSTYTSNKCFFIIQDGGVSARGSRQNTPAPCTLKHREKPWGRGWQQEYNSLFVNALNRIFKSNLSLNNFKWLLTKLELSFGSKYHTPFQKTPLKWIPRSKSGASKSRPRWAAHTRIGNVWEYQPRVLNMHKKFRGKWPPSSLLHRFR